MVSPAAFVEVTHWVLLLAAREVSIKVRNVVRSNRSPTVGVMLFIWKKSMAGSTESVKARVYGD